MISGEVMPVIGKWLNYMSRLHDGVDAILIADRHGTIEYSAMFSEQENGLADELGTLETAVAKACELAGIADADTVYLQSSTSDLSRLLDIMGTEDSLDVSGTLKELENRVGLE